MDMDLGTDEALRQAKLFTKLARHERQREDHDLIPANVNARDTPLYFEVMEKTLQKHREEW